MTLGAAIILAGVAGLTTAPHQPTGATRTAAFHSIATVSDTRSHGVVGDGFLSLNEAIQLHNRTLLTSQLSAAEVLQLGGPGADISWINIDASWTPTITVEQDLDLILDFPHGLLIQGFNGNAIIDFSGPGLQHGFRSVSSFVSWRNLDIVGGNYGIDMQQADGNFAGGTVLDNVHFDGQSQFSLRATGIPTGTPSPGSLRLLLDGCRFVNTPAAILCDDSLPDRSTIFAAFSTDIQATTTGIDFLIGTGGSALSQFDRCSIETQGTGFAARRTPGSNRPLTLGATHLRVVAQDCVELQGEVAGVSQLTLRMLDLTAPGGGTALDIGPLGSVTYGVLEDSTLVGDSAIEVGGGPAFAVSNARFANGAVTLGTTTPATLPVRMTKFDACAVAVTGTNAIPADACCVVGGSVNGLPVAPVDFTASYFAAGAASNVSISTPLPAEQLGGIEMQPYEAVRGGNLTLQADLPPGLFAVFVLGLTIDPPLLLSPDLHVYLDLNASPYIPGGIFQLQQGLVVPIPNIFYLQDTDWVFQAAVLPGPGVQAPELQVPPGRRFVIR